MDIKEKVISNLIERFEGAHIRLEDDAGITGYLVSPRFAGMTSIERQYAIEDALLDGSFPLLPPNEAEST